MQIMIVDNYFSFRIHYVLYIYNSKYGQNKMCELDHIKISIFNQNNLIFNYIIELIFLHVN